MTGPCEHFLLAYFLTEHQEHGEQVRLATSEDSHPTRWTPLAGGEPFVLSTVGEQGARDPFLIRDGLRNRFVMLATDLRTWPDGDWGRATHRGSRSILVWESLDLVTWTESRLLEVAPHNAGNAWAPKAFWSPERVAWVIIFACALYPDAQRAGFRHQRLMMVTTTDFVTVTRPEVYFDPGHDVIDATFVQDGPTCYRFSANTQGSDDSVGHHIFMEHGSSMLAGDFEPLAVDVGREHMRHGEGPAAFASLDTDSWFLLIDDIDGVGYHLFETDDLATARWRPVPDVQFPAGARHGSVLPITAAEHSRLVSGTDRRDGPVGKTHRR